MVLEATMICLDNSDWMRNGDYAPSRLEAQKDAAGLICNDRTGSNPENTVGILSMAGQGVEMLVSPTEEAGKILAAFASVNIGGKSDLLTAVQIAQLALKHRKNKNGGQRIVAFVGAPVEESVERLQKIGKQLKKNNVAVDVVSMGESEYNSEKLLEFVNAANSNDNSHLITVPPGVSPANAVLSSAVMTNGGFATATAAGNNNNSNSSGGDFDMYGGVDPAMDPELAMAIRVSTEEARAQEEARTRAAATDSSAAVGAEEKSAEGAATSTATTAGAGVASSSSSSNGGVPFGGFGAADEEDEEALMQRALEMSMQEMMSSAEAAAAAAASDGGSGATPVTTAVAEMQLDAATPAEEDDEEEQLKKAMSLSVAAADALQNADSSDPLVQAAMQQLADNNSGSSSDGGDEAGKKRKGDDI